MGIYDALRHAGVEDGDTVQIHNFEMVWGYEAIEERFRTITSTIIMPGPAGSLASRCGRWHVAQ